jgi:phage-related protein
LKQAYNVRIFAKGTQREQKVSNDINRIFCFFDKGDLIILLNGFQKKTQKTPKQEIARAERLKIQYHEDQEKK